MVAGINQILLRWRWMVMMLIALSAVIGELVEHRPVGLHDLNPELLHEILIFGLIPPLVGGIMLTMLTEKQNLTSQTKNKTKQRVLIVEHNSLLGAGMESLLNNASDLYSAGVTPNSKDELIQSISEFQPDVVILDKTSSLINSVGLSVLLKNHPKLRVVAVSANDNLLHIYNKQQVLIMQAADLVNIIRYSYNSVCI